MDWDFFRSTEQVSIFEQKNNLLFMYLKKHGIWICFDFKGKIRTSRKLDRETKSFYWLTVVARDQGVVPLSSSAEIFVRVWDRNDNAPIPIRPLFRGTIKENSPANSVIVRVEATDPDVDNDGESDSRLTYRINQGDPQSFFKIDSKTGILLLK